MDLEKSCRPRKPKPGASKYNGLLFVDSLRFLGQALNFNLLEKQ